MKITLSKKQWKSIGNKTGWIKSAQLIQNLENQSTEEIEQTNNTTSNSENLQVSIYLDTNKTYLRYSKNSRSAAINDIDAYGAWELLGRPHLIVTVYTSDKKPKRYIGQEAITFMNF